MEDLDKRGMLLSLLSRVQGLTLVFVERKKSADYLENWLIKEGVQAISIHGDKSQDQREYALSLFRSGRCPVLVLTDPSSSLRFCSSGVDRRHSSLVTLHSSLNTLKCALCVQVATDVAARGLDIPMIETVVNFDCPANIEVYVVRHPPLLCCDGSAGSTPHYTETRRDETRMMLTTSYSHSSENADSFNY